MGCVVLSMSQASFVHPLIYPIFFICTAKLLIQPWIRLACVSECRRQPQPAFALDARDKPHPPIHLLSLTYSLFVFLFCFFVDSHIECQLPGKWRGFYFFKVKREHASCSFSF